MGNGRFFRDGNGELCFFRVWHALFDSCLYGIVDGEGLLEIVFDCQIFGTIERPFAGTRGVGIWAVRCI